ncbi:hypothetical protein JYK17_17405 [Streptomyces sp. KC 17012]|uniref:hypothetical protein n=1 Tax=Streptomyces plumbidurans TaxID=2814589 RepID=UPI001C9DD95A|nr:hypothetical protein [Streptomyces plumbidurans]MBY8341809.1 hypothetical protein [Streptomyces plumbidurans]
MANPQLSTLQDSFAAPALNTTLWNNSSAAPDVLLDPALDRVQISCTSTYPAFGGNGPWALTNDALYARVSPPPVGAGTTQMIMRVVVDANNRASLFFDAGGILTASVVNAGTTTTTVIGAYDAFNHSWWRIREAGGNILFDTAPDGWTWTTRATIAHTWSAAAVQVIWLCGFSGTEAAGLAGYVDHVNTTTSAPDQLNLNFPLVEDAWAPYWSANGGAFPLDRFVDVGSRTRGTASFDRGRQYETDQVRSGEAQLLLANNDALLDPTNADGPWYGNIYPYQPYRRRAQWPPTRNLLDQAAASGGDLGGFSGTINSATSDIFSSTDTSGGTVTPSATAWQGSTVLQFSVPSASAIAARVCHTPRWSVTPGQTYTMQIRVRDVTAATSLGVKAFIAWHTAGGGATPTSFTYGTPATLTGSTTAAWTTLTVTATAPANAAGIDVGVALSAAAAATCSLQADGWQLEKGTAATTWQAPGIWYPVYAGFMERWPEKWDGDGTYGLVNPNAVDAFALLSQQTLSDPLTEEITSNQPRFLFKLDDPAEGTTAADTTGTYPPAQQGISKYGAGSFVFGTEITATDATGVYTGSSGTVATVDNSFPGTNTIGPATFLRLGASGILGPADPSAWTRMIAFKYTGPTPTTASVFWSSFDRQRSGGSPSGSELYWQIGADGRLAVVLRGPSGGAGVSFAPGPTALDGDWHLMLVGYSRASATLRFHVDGVTYLFSSVDPALEPSGLVSDNVGAYVDPTVGNGTFLNFKGDISFVAEFPSQLSALAMTNIYTAWRSACAGESTDARYARILRYAGYSGSTSIDTGLTTSMGPATLADSDAVSCLQAVVDTEGGAHYVDRAGAVVFKSRAARYNATVPLFVFGERADLGELPYENAERDFDPTRLANDVTVTQESTGQLFYAEDAASKATYFTRTMTRTVNSSSSTECQDAANYLLSRYRQPAKRISTMTLHPSANPALWPACLSLELGTRARVMRRPQGSPESSTECFIENISWDWNEENDAVLTLQCSPADLTPYGIIAAWHTTLASSIAAGVSSITIHASQDNTNLLAAQLAAGQQLTLGQGTANAETVTVSAVGATSPGWTTATITLTAATTKSHTAGDTLCEPLPAGTTDPTTWDAVSRFDSIAFAY